MTVRFKHFAGLLPALALTGLAAPQLTAQPAISQTAKPITSAAVEPQPKIYLSPDGTTIYLVGSIMADSFKRFDAVLASAPHARTLFLASPGGLTIEARLIAAEVRKHRLNTYVEQYCASACTQLFVAGRERIIGKEAVLGFHQAVGVDRRGRTTRVTRATDRALNPTEIFGINGNDTLRLAYELAGLDQAFIEKVLTKSHSDMWFPTVKEMTDSHVITRQADKPEFALPEGSISQADLKILLAKRALWERAARLYPENYAKGFGTTWRLGNTGSPLELAISAGRSDLIVAMMGRLAQASDTVLDQHLTLYANEARHQAETNYAGCAADLDSTVKPLSAETLKFEQAEDLLLVSALDNPPATAQMSRKDAMNIFAKDIMPLLPKGFSSVSNCKAGFQMVEAIGKLTGKKRIRTYRAMLFLPEALGV